MKEWRVLEKVSIDSVDYVLLRRVPPPRSGSRSLTTREHSALVYACTGATNKEVACKMGISPSTVGVLLWRAARKLGATDRDDLLRSFRARPPESPPSPRQPRFIAQLRTWQSLAVRNSVEQPTHAATTTGYYYEISYNPLTAPARFKRPGQSGARRLGLA
jgi:DNA-binding CsgD family transcriptional regulator